MQTHRDQGPTRRDLLRMIGLSAGGAALYQAMTALGVAAESPFQSPLQLTQAARGASVLVLGAGLAGMTAAYELQRAGYSVQVLEYNARPGGRNWSLRGGDSFTELGGATQTCQFDQDLCFNPGPWRIPHHHRALLHYCKALNVPLEPFIQVNANAYLHSSRAFGGKPRRFREVHADYQGYVAELLAKATHQGALDVTLSREDRERLLFSLRMWGALDGNHRYTRGESSSRRGYQTPPGGGLAARPIPSEPIGLSDLLTSGLWATMARMEAFDMQPSFLQPVGGMGRIGEAFGRELKSIIRYRAKVTHIQQDAHGVTATYEDTTRPGAALTARADWCVCTLPLPILAQIPLNVGPALAQAISAVPYASSLKAGLQFKRRFWEEDEQIYGGITYTDLPPTAIAYPSSGFHSHKGVLLGAYMWGPNAMEVTAMPPEQRLKTLIHYGSQIHPQYPEEFDNGITVGWHRMPFTLGCFGLWSDEARARHYDALCQIDGRIVLAGEHASFLGGWQEGAVTSALDAVERLHIRALAEGARV